MVLTVVVAVVVLALVFALAAAVVGREANRLGRQRHLPTYRLPDAVAWIGDRLDPGPAGRLTHGDVTALVGWHLAELQRQAAEGDVAAVTGTTVVSDDPGLVAVVAEADAAGLDVEVGDVAAVMSLQLDYLRALGALREVSGGPSRVGRRP